MVELLGTIGLILLLCTLVPFVLRRLGVWCSAAALFSRYHQILALTGAALLTLHGFLALMGGHGSMAHTGLLTWLVLVAVIILALTASRRRPFAKTHCWVVVLLTLMVILHVFFTQALVYAVKQV